MTHLACVAQLGAVVRVPVVLKKNWPPEPIAPASMVFMFPAVAVEAAADCALIIKAKQAPTTGTRRSFDMDLDLQTVGWLGRTG